MPCVYLPGPAPAVTTENFYFKSANNLWFWGHFICFVSPTSSRFQGRQSLCSCVAPDTNFHRCPIAEFLKLKIIKINKFGGTQSTYIHSYVLHLYSCLTFIWNWHPILYLDTRFCWRQKHRCGTLLYIYSMCVQDKVSKPEERRSGAYITVSKLDPAALRH